MKRTGLARKTPLDSRSTLARSRLRSKPRRRETVPESAAWREAFVAIGKGRCVVCGKLPARGALHDAHHVVPKRFLDELARRSGLGPSEAERLRWDVRNGVPACRKDHDRHETAFRRMRLDELPAEAWEFAHEWGFGSKLASWYDA